MLNRITLGFVSALGFLAVASILTAPTTLTPIVTDEVDLSSREPASIEIGEVGVPEKRGIQVIKLTCEPEMKMNQDSHQIRLRGRVCSEGPVTIEKSTVKNSENEEVATVFHKEKTFTTDVIHLRPGSNKLVITNVLSDGSTSTQVLVVERAAPQRVN